MARPKKRFEQSNTSEIRVPLPRDKQVIGLVLERLGFGKSRVACADGKERICRIPGARRRDLWIRPDNFVLVDPWKIQGETKGDILYQYTPAQVSYLKNKGLLTGLITENEF